MLALVTAVAGHAVGISPSSALISSQPVAETGAGYLKPPVLLSSAPSVLTRQSAGRASTATDAPVEGPAPQDAPSTSDEATAPQQGYFTYTIQPGDTVDSVAVAFGIDPGYITWNNPEISDPDSLIIGGTLLIPATNGLVYHVTLGDTLNGIADAYGVDVNSIVSYGPNALTSPDNVVEGMVLVVPGAAIPAPAPPAIDEPMVASADDGGVSSDPGLTASSGLIWPWYGGISQYFGEPELGSYHKGLDIEGGIGGTIIAAASGTVVLTAWDDYGLGYHVIIDHGNGMQTIYGHLSDIWVSQGQYVNQGDAIGALGNTGYSTGPHLHFQINMFGTPVDPLGYLP